MAIRNDDPYSLKPDAYDNTGIRWELIEPFLRQREAEGKRESETFAGCWRAVKGVRTVHDQHGEWLTWTVYGRALIGGDYEINKLHLRTTCPHCGHDAASLSSYGSLLKQVCKNCRLEHRRALARLAAKRRRRTSGEVTTPTTKPCAHCGKSFKPQRSTATFCSTKCRVAAHRTKPAQQG